MSERLDGLRVLTISAYDAEPALYRQHRFRDMFPGAQWTHIGLQPDHFSWRVRGNALRLAHHYADELGRGYDLIIVTSLVDLATLRGLAPKIIATPTLVYFYENPFSYSENNRSYGASDAQMTAMYTALASDQCIFNSRHNLSIFMSGIAAMVDKMPEEFPPGLVQQLLAKSVEIPLPLAEDMFADAQPASEQGSLRILWNHRWGFDKGPERLLAFVKKLDQSDLDAKLVLTGYRTQQIPLSMAEVENNHGRRIALSQYESDRQRYRARMANADVVLSTSRHDFQGIDVMEAAAVQCVPLLPDRLSYPEFFPDLPRYHSTPDIDNEANNAVALLRQWRGGGFPPAPDMTAYRIAALEQRYEAVIDSMLP